MADPYRFGGPIPEAVRRMQARRFAAGVRAKLAAFDAAAAPVLANPGVLTRAEIAAVENRMPPHSGTRR